MILRNDQKSRLNLYHSLEFNVLQNFHKINPILILHDVIIKVREKPMCENCEINTLLLVYLSADQIPALTAALIEEKFHFTQIASRGGFLNLSTNTLLIGINNVRHDKLKVLLDTHCSKRRTHIATHTQMEAHFQPSQPIIIEAETGGATIMTLPVEHFEQF
jgi:uncharacterized protein YaaQ